MQAKALPQGWRMGNTIQGGYVTEYPVGIQAVTGRAFPIPAETPLDALRQAVPAEALPYRPSAENGSGGTSVPQAANCGRSTATTGNWPPQGINAARVGGVELRGCAFVGFVVSSGSLQYAPPLTHLSTLQSIHSPISYIGLYEECLDYNVESIMGLVYRPIRVRRFLLRKEER